MTFHDMSCDDLEDCMSWYNDDTVDQLMAATNKVSETEALNDFTIDSFSTLTWEDKFLALKTESDEFHALWEARELEFEERKKRR